MEVIHLSGYTEEEKEKIAFQFLIPHQKEENGLKDHPSPSPRKRCIKSSGNIRGKQGSKFRAGDRHLCRKVAKEVAMGNASKEVMDEALVEELLGPRKFFREVAQERDRVGVATGLAWTENGGDILFIEASKMKGDKGLILTGSLGEVMKESAQAALLYSN
jgi:ATP-dependent Lon protease